MNYLREPYNPPKSYPQPIEVNPGAYDSLSAYAAHYTILATLDETYGAGALHPEADPSD